MIDKNEIKKDLYKSKNKAKFSHYSFGKVYYIFEALGGTFMFPIHTTEKVTKTFSIGDIKVECMNVTELSSDLGETDFSNEMKGSDLNRWIAKAIDKNELIQIK